MLPRQTNKIDFIKAQKWNADDTDDYDSCLPQAGSLILSYHKNQRHQRSIIDKTKIGISLSTNPYYFSPLPFIKTNLSFYLIPGYSA